MNPKRLPVGERKIRIINHAAFARSYQSYLSGQTNFAELSGKDYLLDHYETKPINGFEFPDGFPDCCEWHRSTYRVSVEKYNEFPNCCANHAKLVGQPWFDKLTYIYTPQKVVETITFTIDCIEKCIGNENWYKEITDYIQYTIDSYGQYPAGFGPPLGLSHYVSSIESSVQTMPEVPMDKCERLLDFLSTRTHTGKKTKSPDLNKLIDIYKEWLRLFPFELSYLSHLKPTFSKLIPILHGPVETNMYTGIASSKLSSKKELLEFLNKATLHIIKEMNALEAFKKGILNDKKETQIQLLIARRKIELGDSDLTGKASGKQYVKLLKKWLKDEKKFVSELTPLLNDEFSNEAFILNMIDGMKLLQSGDTNEDCLMNIRNKGTNKESKIRYWFRNFLTARYRNAVVTAEEENGPGRMDLKVYHAGLGTKVIEFKGWWNQDKNGTAEQVINYLTDFEGEGFIFMINHLSVKDIQPDYQKMIEDPATGYEAGSWTAHPIPNADLAYFRSQHKFGIKTKNIYHFIFNVNF